MENERTTIWHSLTLSSLDLKDGKKARKKGYLKTPFATRKTPQNTLTFKSRLFQALSGSFHGTTSMKTAKKKKGYLKIPFRTRKPLEISWLLKQGFFRHFQAVFKNARKYLKNACTKSDQRIWVFRRGFQILPIVSPPFAILLLTPTSPSRTNGVLVGHGEQVALLLPRSVCSVFFLHRASVLLPSLCILLSSTLPLLLLPCFSFSPWWCQGQGLNNAESPNMHSHLWGSDFDPHPQPQNSLLRIFRLKPGLEWKFLLRRTWSGQKLLPLQFPELSLP